MEWITDRITFYTRKFKCRYLTIDGSVWTSSVRLLSEISGHTLSRPFAIVNNETNSFPVMQITWLRNTHLSYTNIHPHVCDKVYAVNWLIETWISIPSICIRRCFTRVCLISSTASETKDSIRLKTWDSSPIVNHQIVT